MSRDKGGGSACGKAIRYHTGGFCRLVLWHLVVGAVLMAQSPLERAVTLTREKRYQEADAALTGVIEPAQTAQRIAYHRLKAAIAAGLGDKTAAVTQMRAALSLGPHDAALLLATAVAELQAGRLEDALEHAVGAGNTASAYTLIADIQEQRGEAGKAVAAYRSAINLAPHEEGLQAALGFELIKRQRLAEAVELLAQSVSEFPRSAKLLTLFGIAHYAQGDGAEAIAALQHAIEADPTLDAAYRCLSKIVLQSSAAPSENVRATLCTWSKTVCSALRLRAAREQGDSKAAMQAVTDLERVPAEDAVAACELARAYEWTDRLSDARARMEACVRFDPSAQNHYRLAQLYRRLGLSQLANEELEARRRSLDEVPGEGAIGANDLRPLK